MIPRSREYRVCIGTGYTGGTNQKFWAAAAKLLVCWAKLLVCWVYRGPIGKDETDGEMVVWFQ